MASQPAPHSIVVSRSLLERRPGVRVMSSHHVGLLMLSKRTQLLHAPDSIYRARQEAGECPFLPGFWQLNLSEAGVAQQVA